MVSNRIGGRKMDKVVLEPDTVLYPLPAVMVSCRDKAGKDNIITLAWVGTVCSEPPMVSISIRPGRFSSHMVKETGEFVINLPTRELLEIMDYCGSRSGRHEDKFEHLGIEKAEASKVNVPIIKASPVNIECRVKHMLSLGSHDMFVAEVVAADVREDIVSNHKIDFNKLDLIAYVGTTYFSLGDILGKQGFSVRKSI
jgi:flavin reductase (DIM6/NTAB) family NADH-FMN oxidoreductase RutF